MAIVLRFVDNDDFLSEFFFNIVWVEDTTTSTLQKEIKKVLDLHELCIDKMRGQGYDGASNMQELLVAGERETSRGANQIGTLHRPGATRWSSHYDLIVMYDAVCTALENIKKDGSIGSLRGEATGGYNAIRQFEFVFILHLLQEIILIDIFCRELQHKSQDIVNAMNVVGTTKDVLGKLILNGWETFIGKVDLFCKKHDIDMPDMNAQYKVGTCRSCQHKDNITVEHHYHFDIFNDAIDFELAELNSRFSEWAMELLILSSALQPCKEILSSRFHSKRVTYFDMRARRMYLIILYFKKCLHSLNYVRD
ncbi:uncharacterized protein LOC110750491 [Prunus avium]|uniref:Uncharacterized protein LOC110750491 n=1 Tax=Prunus avium TaxID=42229 RepID=A0A6P5RNQ1_PRUAV|nr:uncharacterized protein LOC110750491 [Prunus avium]